MKLYITLRINYSGFPYGLATKDEYENVKCACNVIERLGGEVKNCSFGMDGSVVLTSDWSPDTNIPELKTILALEIPWLLNVSK